MAFELPTDLIRQVQIALRKDARISSYDPLDPTLRPLPSLAASVAGLNPSPPHLRCKHCKGRLLNGLQSLICRYCGKHQKGDVPHEPISFKSSSGCQFLLKSLGLNGSEMIGVPIKGTDSNRGSSTLRKRIPLSKLLDLQIKWLDWSLKPETNTTNKTVEHTTIFLNFTGVDLDDFFPGSKNDTVHNSNEKQPEISNWTESNESKTVPRQDNPTLFHNLPPSETAVRSFDEVSGNAFAGWDANFQSADSANQHDGSKSVDSFIDSTSTIDLSAHMDSVFGGERPQLDSNTKGNVDWFDDNQWPTNMTTNEGDDPFDAWNAFTSSTIAQDPSEVATVNDLKSEIYLFDSTNNSQEVDFGSFSQAELRSAEANYNLLEDHITDRIGDAKSKVPEDIERVAEKGDMVNVPAWSNDCAENIATQMHDLSFMLDSSLSVPPKSDRLSSFSQD